MVPKQVNDLAALVALGSAVMLIAVKSAGEYENFHSSPAGSLAAELKERFSRTLPPTGAIPEESDNETCAELIETEANTNVDKSVSLRKQHCRMFISLGILSFLGNSPLMQFIHRDEALNLRFIRPAQEKDTDDAEHRAPLIQFDQPMEKSLHCTLRAKRSRSILIGLRVLAGPSTVGNTDLGCAPEYGRKKLPNGCGGEKRLGMARRSAPEP